MSTSLGLLSPFDPVAAEWPRCAEVRRATCPGTADAPRGTAPAATGWFGSLGRWLAKMPPDLPPRD